MILKKTVLIITLVLTGTSMSFSQIGSSKIGIEISNQAPEIRLPGPAADTIALTSLRGKIVLIDFWASWCAPCMQEQPQLKKLYNHYQHKTFSNANGFTIYGVSLDSKKTDWVNAIQKLRIEWPQVSDLRFWNSAPANLYKLDAIPANVLIDGNGIIIAKDIHGKALFTELDRLLKKSADQ